MTARGLTKTLSLLEVGLRECGGRLSSAWCDTADQTSETYCSLQTRTNEHSQPNNGLIQKKKLVYWQQSFEATILNWHCTTYLLTARCDRWHEGQQWRCSTPVCSGPASGWYPLR